MDTKWLRNSFVYLIILVAIIALFFTVFQPGAMDRDAQIGLNELAAAVKRGEVKRIDVAEDKLTIEIPGRGKFTARKERTDSVQDVMSAYGVTPEEFGRVDYRVSDPPQFTNWLGLAVNFPRPGISTVILSSATSMRFTSPRFTAAASSLRPIWASRSMLPGWKTVKNSAMIATRIIR